MNEKRANKQSILGTGTRGNQVNYKLVRRGVFGPKARHFWTTRVGTNSIHLSMLLQQTLF